MFESNDQLPSYIYDPDHGGSLEFRRAIQGTAFSETIDHIKELEPVFHGDLQITLRDGTRLTLSRTYRAPLEKILGNRL